MKIAAIQMRLGKTKRENLEKALKYISDCKGCDLVVLPEMLMGNRGDGVELYDLAEDVEYGDFALALKEAAFNNNLDVCACLWEESGEDKVYNTAMVYGADGTVKTKYRKLHLFDALSVRESDYMLPGSELPPVFDCAGFKCGLAICYDLRFPEIFRSMKEADVFVVPMAWYGGYMKVEHLHMLMGSRALENTSYSVCANLCGENFAGHSVTFTPFGELIESLSNNDDLLIIQLDKEVISGVREKLPCLENLRKDVFKS